MAAYFSFSLILSYLVNDLIMRVIRQKFKYHAVRDRIVKTILERNLEEGSMLPAESELCADLQVSRNTVRSALDLLVSDGTLVKRPGHPCVICQPVASKPPRKIAWINAGEGTAGFNPVYSDIFRFTTEEAIRRHLQLELIYLFSAEMIQNFAAKANDYIGIIFNSTRPAEFNDRLLRLFPGRLVVVDSIRHSEPCNLVQTDNFAGACMAVEHLWQQGHRLIGIVGSGAGYATYQPFADRLRGYQHVLAKYGLPEFNFICSDQENIFDLSEYLQRLLPELRKCDALFVTNDLLSAILMADFQMLGIDVPGDISMISFDGISLSRFTTPTLTSIRQPMEKIASEIIDMVLDHEAGERVFPKICRLKPDLLSGNSVKFKK